MGITGPGNCFRSRSGAKGKPHADQIDTGRRGGFSLSSGGALPSYTDGTTLYDSFWPSFLDHLFTFPKREVVYAMGMSVPSDTRAIRIDPETLTITFRGRSCFLGRTLPFRLFHRLACRPNAYVSYEDLLTDVWDGERTDEAIRSVVKTLRCKLRQAGMKQLADAIDGSVPGHYALKLRDTDV